MLRDKRPVPYLSGNPEIRAGPGWSHSGVAQWVPEGADGVGIALLQRHLVVQFHSITENDFSARAGVSPGFRRLSVPAGRRSLASPSRPHLAQRQRSTWAEPRRGQSDHLSASWGFAVAKEDPVYNMIFWFWALSREGRKEEKGYVYNL